jgi:hypothetical protein
MTPGASVAAAARKAEILDKSERWKIRIGKRLWVDQGVILPALAGRAS